MLIFILGSFGCAHVQTLNDSQFQDIKDEDTGIIAVFTLEADGGVINDGDCTLNFRKPSGFVDYPVHIELGKHLIFAKLDPGSYFVNDLYCGGSRDYDLTMHKWPKIMIKENRISFIYPVRMHIEHNAYLNALIFGGDEARAELSKTMEKLSKPTAKRLISGDEVQALP